MRTARAVLCAPLQATGRRRAADALTSRSAFPDLISAETRAVSGQHVDLPLMIHAAAQEPMALRRPDTFIRSRPCPTRSTRCWRWPMRQRLTRTAYNVASLQPIRGRDSRRVACANFLTRRLPRRRREAEAIIDVARRRGRFGRRRDWDFPGHDFQSRLPVMPHPDNPHSLSASSISATPASTK